MRTVGRTLISQNPDLKPFANMLVSNIAKLDLNGQRFFTQKTISGVVHEMYEEYGLGYGRALPDGADPSDDDWHAGYKKTVKVSTWHNGVTFTKRSLTTDSTQIASAQRKLQASFRATKEQQYAVFNYYALQGRTVPANGGLALCDPTGIDGLSYFNGTHTYLGYSQTYSNIPTVNTSWGLAGLQLTVGIKRGQMDYNGEKFGADEPFLSWIVGDGLITKAGVTLQTETDPETANRANNAMRYGNVAGGPAQKYETWGKLQDNEFLARFRVPADNPGWCEVVLKNENPASFDFTSESGQRRMIGWMYTNVLTGRNPREYITCFAAV